MKQQRDEAQKHVNFIRYALVSLTVYRVRTIAVVFSLTTAVFLLGSIVFIADGLSRDAVTAAQFAPDITVQGMSAGRVAPFPLTYANNIAQMTGVDRVVPRMWGYVLSNDSIYTIMGIDPEYIGLQGIPDYTISIGRYLKIGETREAVIGVYFAKSRNLVVNDTFELKGMSGMVSSTKSFRVVGIFSSAVSLYTSDLILLNKYEAQEILLLARAASATDLCVYIKNPGWTKLVADSITKTYPELRVLTRQAIIDATETTYGLRGGFATVIWFILLATVVLIAWNQASTVGQDSKREVGILKTLGFSTLDILEIRLIEAVTLGFLSASVGVFLAIFYDAYLNAPFLRDFMLGWSASLPAFALPIEVSSSRLLILYAVAVFPLLLGSLIPAWLSAITEPDTVLRGS